MRLLGKLALVFGGTSGIGAAIARAFAKEGASVVAYGRRGRAGAVTRPEAGEVAVAQLDVTDEAAVKARYAELPTPDLVVCAAGTGTFGPIHTATVADLRAMLDTHIVGTFVCAREALRRMQPERRGHIVAIASHVADRTFPDCGGYTAAKAGQRGLMRVLAEEARPYDIRVTTVMPGATDTPIWDDRPGFDRSRMMKPDDLAGLLVAIVARPALAIDEITVTPPAGAL
ncbi:MAG: SDR family oxidoreductase [Myxococcales bacterium]|nr:SDR family oxidoreductase [Myxococcales bacterium]